MASVVRVELSSAAIVSESVKARRSSRPSRPIAPSVLLLPSPERERAPPGFLCNLWGTPDG